MEITTLFRGVSVLAWIAVIVLFIMAAVRASRNQPLRNATRTVLVVVVIAVLLTTLSSGMVFISPQERGVVISAVAPGGYRTQALQPGLNWIIPFAESVVTYPISKQSYTMSIAAAEGQIQGDDSIAARTADGQEIYVDASVIYSIDPTKVVDVHITWQDRYQDGLVRAQSRGVIRDVVSQYGVEEVNSTKRAEMTAAIRETMQKKLAENGLTLDDFILRNIAFSKEYATSVEQKQIAEQQAQQAKYVVESKKQEAEQARQTAQGRADAIVIDAEGNAKARLLQAEAESKALQMLSDSLKNNPDLQRYLYITKLAPNTQVMVLPSSSPFLFPLPGLGTGQTLETQP